MLPRVVSWYLGSGFPGRDCNVAVFVTNVPAAEFILLRSEERRVGKECRSRWSPYH